MTLELVLLRTGGLDIAHGRFEPWHAEPLRSELRRQPVWSALIRTVDGNVLFDTGIHPVHVTRPEATFGTLPYMKVVMASEDGIVGRLAEVGVRPEEIDVVVNSHMHFDHTGNNGAFTRARFLVQRDHLAFAREHLPQSHVYWDIPELTYVPLEGRTRVARGVEVIPTPGHAPGHQSLIVDLPETGRIVLCGDAAFTRENLERGDVTAADPESARESLSLIRSLVRDDLDRAFPSHDANAWASWRHAPVSYH
jgi:N-acyl homoserine lactone hydrolase